MIHPTSIFPKRVYHSLQPLPSELRVRKVRIHCIVILLEILQKG